MMAQEAKYHTPCDLENLGLDTIVIEIGCIIPKLLKHRPIAIPVMATLKWLPKVTQHTGMFSRGANSGLVPFGMVYDCAKFHVAKCTIL